MRCRYRINLRPDGCGAFSVLCRAEVSVGLRRQRAMSFRGLSYWTRSQHPFSSVLSLSSVMDPKRHMPTRLYSQGPVAASHHQNRNQNTKCPSTLDDYEYMEEYTKLRQNQCKKTRSKRSCWRPAPFYVIRNTSSSRRYELIGPGTTELRESSPLRTYLRAKGPVLRTSRVKASMHA